MKTMENNFNWGEVYSNPVLAKEIGNEVISVVKESNKLCTHDGVYHADDVFSTALLMYVCGENIEVIRTREPLENIFTFDVGGKTFDHHQCDEYRDGCNGIFASFGKLWCTLGRTIKGLREEAWREIDESFVKAIDLTDNTGIMNPVNFWINSQKTAGVDFMDVVSAAFEMLSEIIYAGIKKSKELDTFEEEVKKAPEGKVLHLSRFYSVNREIYKNYDFAWITFPDISGNITIQAVGGQLMSLEKRGLGPMGDIIFTHKGGWIGKAKTIKAALSLIEQ